MRVLITGAASPLARAIAESLRTNHQVSLTDREEISTDLEFVRSDLGHDEATDALMQGIDAIVHLAYAPRPNDGENEWLDANTRRHYNLLLAASEAGVSFALVISTLDLFQPYDVEMTVGEHWQPQPNTSPAQLGAHLAEFTAREFAHSNALDITVLRLGHAVLSEEVAEQAYDPMWVDQRDAARAVDLLLQKRKTLDLRRPRSFHIFHLQSVSDRARFSSERICSALEFQPHYSFEYRV